VQLGDSDSNFDFCFTVS